MLKHYKNCYTKCSPSDVGEFVFEYIHYDIKTMRDKRVIFTKQWLDSGIFFIGRPINTNGKVMSWGIQKKMSSNYRNELSDARRCIESHQ